MGKKVHELSRVEYENKHRQNSKYHKPDGFEIVFTIGTVIPVLYAIKNGFYFNAFFVGSLGVIGMAIYTINFKSRS